MRIAIVGLGYVSLPLTLQFARNGGEVLGMDVDSLKVTALNAGSIVAESVETEIAAGCFQEYADFSRAREVDAIIIYVPTLLSTHREPDTSYVRNSGRALAPHLKPGVLVELESNMRESPAFVLMDELKRRGAEVEYYDPFIPVVMPTREHRNWAGKRSIAWNREELVRFDAVVIATAHEGVDYRQLVECADIIIDTRNALAAIPARPGQVWKA